MQSTRSVPTALERYVLAVGAANMDITGSTDNPLTPGDSIPGRVRCAPGGVARNVAENLARLGHAVSLVSVVGDDLNGRSLLDATGGAGVDVSACRVLPGQSTSTYLSLHGADGDMALALNDMAILDCITAQRLAALAGVAEHVRGAAAVLLDCNLAPDALQWLFARSRGRPVFVDPVSAFKCRRLLPWLDQVHTLKANRLEAQALCGQPVQTDQQVASALRWLLAQGVRQVVLSLGERGVCWGDANGSLGWQRTVPVTVVNATGAGDALLAGLLHGLLDHVPLQRAVHFAVGCAAFTMTAAQANHPGLTVAAVQQLLGATAPH